MDIRKTVWTSPRAALTALEPDAPVLFFCPEALQATARRFVAGFPGLVTFAVKSNPAPEVLDNLAAAGIAGFDVASPAEIALIRARVPGAALHYNNPVRSRREVAVAAQAGIASWSVDCAGELAKLAEGLAYRDTEVAVRLALPVKGAAYDFGAKFGATPDEAVRLLAEVARLGFRPAITFHPGTQCTDPDAWVRYIEASAEIARAAGVEIVRLNVGGGFPSHRIGGERPDLERIFAAIDAATARAFGTARPALVCEPGRGMVAEAFSLAVRVKSLREGGTVYLNDGIYGQLAELPVMGMIDRITVLSPEGATRCGPGRPCTLFGPTCDSLDRLPGQVALPADLAEEDYILIAGMGAYSLATETGFNGYGRAEVATVHRLDA